jgi:hypothetical protein
MEDARSMNVALTQILGGAVVIAGLLMTVYQMRKTSWENAKMRGAKFNRSGFELKTTYPGIIVVGFGVFVLIVSSLTGR